MRAVALRAVALRAVDFRAVDLFAVVLRAVRFAVDFFAVDFLAVDFFAVDLFAVDLLAVDFFAVDFFAVDFFAVDLFAVDFFAVDLRAAVFFFAPPELRPEDLVLERDEERVRAETVRVASGASTCSGTSNDHSAGEAATASGDSPAVPVPLQSSWVIYDLLGQIACTIPYHLSF